MTSGRQTLTDECLILDVSQLLRALGSRSTGNVTCNRGTVICVHDRVHTRLRVAYRVATGQRATGDVELVTDTPNFGGTRTWFACPLCDRRCRKLYVPPNRHLPGCRYCHAVAYRTQLLDPLERAQQRAVNLRVKLGGAAGLAGPVPARPRGMWRRTYWRRLAQSAAVEAKFWQLLAKWVA